MYNIVMEVVDKYGVRSMKRTESEEVVTQDDITYLEHCANSKKDYPDRVSAVVTNVFYVPEEEDRD